uniref:Uncharacterized protein n=1 Tax=Steinernema glaseri TaxID=37863 RepID=A0A1I7ZJR6_9BILA
MGGADARHDKGMERSAFLELYGHVLALCTAENISLEEILHEFVEVGAEDSTNHVGTVKVFLEVQSVISSYPASLQALALRVVHAKAVRGAAAVAVETLAGSA